MTLENADSDHGRKICGAKKRQGEGVCTRPAGWGTEHVGIGRCKLHGGSTITHVKSAQIEQAREDCRRLGVPIEDAQPTEVLLQGVREWAGNCAFYRELAQQLDPGLTHRSIDGDGNPVVVPGIIERTFHAGGKATGMAEAHIYLRLYAEAWDRLRQFAEAAIKNNLDERRIRLEEAEVRTLWQGLAAGIAAAELSPEQTEKLKAEFALHLRQQAALG